MITIIAYHGNLYFDSFVEHVKEIKAKNFTHLLLCITEADFKFNLDTFRGFVIYAEEQGLTVWACFWGLYAGEATISQHDKEGKKLLTIQWLKAIYSIGISQVLIDEPKNREMIDYTLSLSNEIDFHICLCDDTFWKLPDEYIKTLPVKSVGVSNYHFIKDWDKIIERSARIASRLNELRPDDNFVFLQAFDIPMGMEDLPMLVKEICELNKITNFAVWSFKATEATSSKRPFNPKLVWKKIDFN